MSSSEEYLDNLLKSLTEGGDTAGTGSQPSTMQDMGEADTLQNTDVMEDAASEETEQTMSMDDIEAMFASMGTNAPEEGTSTDELVPDDGIISDETVSDDGMMLDEPVSDAGVVLDELPLDDGMISEELLSDDGLLSEELGPEDALLSDEPTSEDSGMEEPGADDFALIDDLLSDGLTSDDLAALEDTASSDETVAGDFVLEETVEEESAPDDFALEETVEEESAPDDFALEETVEEESALDDFALEEATEEDSASDELSLEELGLGDLGLEELGLEENGQESDEEQFALEESAEEEQVEPEESAEGEEAFALEDAGEEDADLSALLASMGGDEDLSEISDLLEKSEQGVALDDDMMAMLGGMSETEEGDESFDFFSGEETEEGENENIRDITPEELAERENPKTKKQKKKEEKERKKREKQAKKAKGGQTEQGENADQEGSDDLSNLLDGAGENEDVPKKPGFFARFIAFLLEEDEEEGDSVEGDSEDVGLVIGNLSDENKALLAELNEEDKQNAKKKDKQDKKGKKDKKSKKDKKKESAARAEGEGDGEGEAKPKKPKKEKKKKEKDVEEELGLPRKKLSKKKVTSVFLFCATIAACIIIVTMLLPEQMEKQEARVAFDSSQYEQVYELLYGKELSEEDNVLFKKSSTILKMQRKLDSYENYRKMDMQLEALNALIEGVSRYQNLRDDAAAYNVSGEVADIYRQILDALENNYRLSEADALDIISSGDDVTYSQRIQAVISGEFFDTEEEQPEGKQDVLPEEEEIIDRLENN